MKLELKHLAPYLPYGLMISQYRDDLNINFTSEMIGLSSDQIKVILSRYPFSERISYYEAKPILRPLSDLNKKLFNNKSMIDILSEWTTTEFDGENILYTNDNYDMVKIDVCELEYHQFVKLLEHHFDVFGLIDKGLAIDINTLES